MTLTQIRADFETLGYGVTTRIKDPLWTGRAKYQTYPLVSGSHGFFTGKAQLIRYLEQVKKIRSWE